MAIVTASGVQRALSLGLVLIAASGCSGSSSSDGSNTGAGGGSQGGTASTGGTAVNGGAAQGGSSVVTGGAALTGGQSTVGGSPSTGGVSPTGGALPTGGTQASPTGGRSSTGGVSPTGGSKATGGTTSMTSSLTTGGKVTGGAATGGKSSVGGAATGGKSTMGGSSAIGGASATGGSANAGGSSGTQGCGLTNYPAACSTSGSPCTMTVNSMDRTYYVYLPSGYNASQKYPLVFQFHPRGGNAEQAINMPSIRNSFPAIYVTPQGLTENGNTGWANTNGQDITFTKQMVATVESSYCVDTTRIFSTGFSYGGMMSFAVGCEMSDVFRAIAPMSGALYSDFNCRGTGPAIAMWGSHGLTDNVVPIADGRAARDKILQQNHCGTTTTATTPSPCVNYDGCDAGYPATWCEFDGTHQIPSFANSAIAAFFKTF